jgi:hypothetical protein
MPLDGTYGLHYRECFKIMAEKRISEGLFLFLEEKDE